MNDLFQIFFLALLTFVIVPAILVGSIIWIVKNKKKGYYKLDSEALKNGFKGAIKGGSDSAAREAYKAQRNNNFIRESLTQYEEETGAIPPKKSFFDEPEARYDESYCKECAAYLVNEPPEQQIGRTSNSEYYCYICSEEGAGGDKIVMVTNPFPNLA